MQSELTENWKRLCNNSLNEISSASENILNTPVDTIYHTFFTWMDDDYDGQKVWSRKLHVIYKYYIKIFYLFSKQQNRFINLYFLKYFLLLTDLWNPFVCLKFKDSYVTAVVPYRKIVSYEIKYKHLLV